jgi:tetratricopeptide (TPR) repeat protein
MWLGSAEMESGDAESAIHTLEEVVERFRTFSGLAYHQAFAHLCLSTAYLDKGDAARARHTASAAVALARDVARYPLAWGRAERVLGRALRALGESAEGEAHLRLALEILGGADIQPETALTQTFLAEALWERGDDAEAAGHLSAALTAFRARGLARFAAQAEELERRFTSARRERATAGASREAV